MNDLQPLLALVLIGLGLYCMMTRHRVLKQVIGLSIMLQGALLSLIDAGTVNGDMGLVQSLVISALIVEAITFAIALALIVNAFRYHPRGRVDEMDTLKG